MHLNLCCSCLERLQDGQSSTRQPPAQVTCAHCQRSWNQASTPRFRPADVSPQVAAHVATAFLSCQYPVRGFDPPACPAPWGVSLEGAAHSSPFLRSVNTLFQGTS